MEDKEFTCRSCSKEPDASINVRRFIERLDACFEKNDLQEAGVVLDFWAKEARALNDSCGLLSVLNETLGYCRRTGDKARALATAEEMAKLLKEGSRNRVSVATVLVNLATTLSHFDEGEKSLDYFKEAEDIYEKYCMDESYEYAACINNRAATYLKMGDDASALGEYRKALGILEKNDGTEKEIAETYANIAELVAKKDLNEAQVYLDKCWETLLSENIEHNGAYAFTLTKCATAFIRLGRTDEAEALEGVAKEIYGE